MNPAAKSWILEVRRLLNLTTFLSTKISVSAFLDAVPETAIQSPLDMADNVIILILEV